MKTKLTSKDLINTGIFSLLFLLATIFAFGFAITPIIQFGRVALSAFLGGPIFLLFVGKTTKPFAITIMGIFCSFIIGYVMFGSLLLALYTFLFFVAAEVICYSQKFKSFKYNAVAYIILGFWTMGSYGAWWFDPDYMYNVSSNSGYAQEWTDQTFALMNSTSLMIVLATTLLAGILSVAFSYVLFKRHFKKAGIV